MIELTIDDVVVDIEGVGISIDYAIAKIGSIDTRSGARSAQINLPKTAKNRGVFENTEDANSLSSKPYTRLEARLKVNGIDQRILFASLESITDTYNIRIYGENVSFYDAIKSKKLVDLDTKDLDHYRTFNNIKDGRTRTTGYLYPIIDNFADSPNFYFGNVAQVFPQYLYPAMFYETMIERIVNDAGYTLENRLLDLPNYPSDGICIPYSSVPFRRNSDVKRYEGTVGIDTTQLNTGGAAWKQVDFQTVIDNGGYEYLKQFFSVSGGVIFIDDIRATFTVTCDVTNTTGSDLIVQFAYSTNQTVSPPEPFYESITVLAGQTVSYSHTFSAMELVYDGSSLPFFAFWFRANATGGSIEVTNAEMQISDVESILERPDIIYTTGTAANSFTTVNSLLPDWTQAKLLMNYLKMFLGLVSVNEQDKVVTLFSFENIANNIHKGKDWSDKIDLTEVEETTFDLGYAQRNNLTYAEDDTVIKPFGTDGVILIADENLEPEEDIVKLDFAATQQVTRLGGKLVSQIKMWSNVGSDDAGMENVVQRILIVRRENFSFEYDDGTTSSLVTTDIPLPYFIDESNTLNVAVNLGFKNNLIEYYQSFISVLDKSKIKTVNLRLNASDINQIDFTIPVFIKYFNSLFYISSISEYTPDSNESTECELVKLF